MDNEAKSCSMDFGCITPEYVHHMWGGTVPLEDIKAAFSRNQKQKFMIIDKKLLDELSAQAKASPRLRKNFDLRNSPVDKSQRMLNALEPGTTMPIHRHLASSETVVLLRGKICWHFYDDVGNETENVVLDANVASMWRKPAGTRWSAWRRVLF